MAEAKLIGSNLKLAAINLLAVKKIGLSDRIAPTFMVYAVENLLMAIFTSENCDYGRARRKCGSHQLDCLIDELPDECGIKSSFKNVVALVAYATTYRYPTASGNLPRPPAENEANDYYEAFIEILNVCTTHFEVDVRLDEPQAGSTSAIR